MINFVRKFRYTDWKILIIVLVLNGTGFVALFGSAVGTNDYRQAIHQLIWLGVGLVLASIIYFLGKRIIFESAYFLYIFFLILLILVPMIGVSAGGSQRWLHIFGFSLQPSEFMKVALLLALARYFSRTTRDFSKFKNLIIPFIMILIPTAVVFRQPDLGTSLVFLGMIFPLMFWAGVPTINILLILAPVFSLLTAFRHISFTIWIFLLLGLLIYFRKSIWEIICHFIFNISFGTATPILWSLLLPYQQNRVLAMFNPDIDPHGVGYQVIQSKTAIGSGGLLGLGFGQGTQTNLKFLPRQNTDFIFSVIGEEWGFLGAGLVLCMFLILLYVLISRAARNFDPFSRIVLFGVAFLFFFHVWINIAMTMGMMPVTGLPLPLLSYGGSFLLTCYLLIGLALNCSSEHYE